jgi:hypothetical protein
LARLPSMRHFLVPAVALLLAGCCRTTVTPAVAPSFAPSSSVQRVASAPADAVFLGTIEHGNNSKGTLERCLDRIDLDAMELGASHVVPTEPTEGDWLYFGRKCAGRAYRVNAR